MLKFIFDRDTWQEIFEGIKQNQFRTIITIFGVMWGVLLLVALLGVSRGFENNFKRLLGDFATNSVFVWTQSTSKPFKGFQKGRTFSMKLSDVDAIKENIKGVKYVVPRLNKQSLVVKGIKTVNVGVFGDYPLFDKIQKKNLVYGRFINTKDINEKRKVCVIEKDVAKRLFEENENPVGQYVDINGISFLVVGMYKQGNQGGGPQGSIHIPFKTFQTVYNKGNKIGWLVVTGEDQYDIKQIETDVKLLLKNIYNVHPDDERAFGSFNLGSFIKRFFGFLKGFKFLTWFVGISTLIAGVFAIGNILLITVKERTKEIGIRRALGAKPAEIRGQIVLESIFLTSIAGAIGIILGGVVLFIIDHSSAVNGENQWLTNPTVNIPIILIAVFILVLLGTLIGLIPATIATNVKPIDALRDE
ncbi:MAG: multidrug ABC transporter ATP-binding protein [Flavobacteriia bacterium]|nr:MAG: multidrug ABC transporter ATP-binding protein [Flavobacteriia bacterium]